MKKLINNNFYLSLMGVMLLGMTSCSNRRQNAMLSDSD